MTYKYKTSNNTSKGSGEAHHQIIRGKHYTVKNQLLHGKKSIKLKTYTVKNQLLHGKKSMRFLETR